MRKTPARAHLAIPAGVLIAFSVVAVAFPLLAGHHILADGDTGVHIRTGEWILDHMAVPRHDVFAQDNESAKWIAHSWLSDMFAEIAHRWDGLSGVAAAHILLIASTMSLFAWRTSRSNTVRPAAAAIVAVAIVGTFFSWMARPHVFTLLLTLLFCEGAERLRNGNRRMLAVLPAAMILWANLHGGWTAGTIVLAAYTVGSALERDTAAAKHLGQALLLCIATSLLTPYGFDGWIHNASLLSDANLMSNVREFMSPDFHLAIAWPLLSWIALIIVALGLGRGPLRPADVLLAACFTCLSLWSARHSALLILTTGPAMAARMFPGNVKAASGWRVPAWSLVVPALLLCVLVHTGALYLGWNPATKPVKAWAILTSEEMPGNVLCNDQFGDWLVYEFNGKKYKPFIDGRGDVHRGKRFGEYIRISKMIPGYEDIIERHNIGWVLWPSNQPLPFALVRSGKWKVVYSDNAATVLVRNVPSNFALIERHQAKNPTR